MGIKADPAGLDYRKVYAKSRAAADKLSRGVQYLLEKNKVALITGEAVSVKPGAITLKDGRLSKAAT
jgi:dihydrolipoamide dehydrogenase